MLKFFVLVALAALAHCEEDIMPRFAVSADIEPFSSPQILAVSEPSPSRTLIARPIAVTSEVVQRAPAVVQLQSGEASNLVNEQVQVLEPIVLERHAQPSIVQTEPSVQTVQVREPVVQTVQVREPVQEREAQVVQVREPEIQTVQIQEPAVQTFQIREPEVRTVQVREPVVRTLLVREPQIQAVQVREPVVQADQFQEPDIQVLRLDIQRILQRIHAPEPVVQTVRVQEPIVLARQVQAPVVQNLVQEPVVLPLEAPVLPTQQVQPFVQTVQTVDAAQVREPTLQTVQVREQDVQVVQEPDVQTFQAREPVSLPELDNGVRTAPLQLSPDQEQFLSPKPYAFGYTNGHDDGSSSHREEQSNESGVVRGSYGYKGPDGLFRTVEYIADADGYRATVRTNEPGMAPLGSAHVQMDVHQVPNVILQRYPFAVHVGRQAAAPVEVVQQVQNDQDVQVQDFQVQDVQTVQEEAPVQVVENLVQEAPAPVQVVQEVQSPVQVVQEAPVQVVRLPEPPRPTAPVPVAPPRFSRVRIARPPVQLAPVQLPPAVLNNPIRVRPQVQFSPIQFIPVRPQELQLSPVRTLPLQDVRVQLNAVQAPPQVQFTSIQTPPNVQFRPVNVQPLVNTVQGAPVNVRTAPGPTPLFQVTPGQWSPVQVTPIQVQGANVQNVQFGPPRFARVQTSRLRPFLNQAQFQPQFQRLPVEFTNVQNSPLNFASNTASNELENVPNQPNLAPIQFPRVTSNPDLPQFQPLPVPQPLQGAPAPGGPSRAIESSLEPSRPSSLSALQPGSRRFPVSPATAVVRLPPTLPNHADFRVEQPIADRPQPRPAATEVRRFKRFRATPRTLRMVPVTGLLGGIGVNRASSSNLIFLSSLARRRW